MSRGRRGVPRGRRPADRNDEQRMVDAIREILGLRPLYAVDCADETAVRIAQDRIDAVAGHSARKGIEHPNSTIDDWRID